jgi:hypothetical protein
VDAVTRAFVALRLAAVAGAPASGAITNTCELLTKAEVEAAAWGSGDTKM